MFSSLFLPLHARIVDIYIHLVSKTVYARAHENSCISVSVDQSAEELNRVSNWRWCDGLLWRKNFHKNPLCGGMRRVVLSTRARTIHHARRISRQAEHTHMLRRCFGESCLQYTMWYQQWISFEHLRVLWSVCGHNAIAIITLVRRHTEIVIFLITMMLRIIIVIIVCCTMLQNGPIFHTRAHTANESYHSMINDIQA